MSEQTKHIPPWDSQTQLFDSPDATCELVLEGHRRVFSIVLWEDYCYFKIADLAGLWAITRPYDRTELPKFVAEQIESGQAGRVYNFEFRFSNLEYLTRQIVESDANMPLITEFPVSVVAIARSDNSALVRAAENGYFVEAMPVSLQNKQLTEAHIPSIWHPGRKLLKQRRLAKLACLQTYPPLSIEAMFVWKKGSLPEAVTLLETLYYYASGNKNQNNSSDLVAFPWPSKRENLVFPLNMQPRMNMIPFLQTIWDHHHFDKDNWLPTRYFHYSTVTNKCNNWQRTGVTHHLILRNDIYKSGHERLETAMKLQDMFKGKISDADINLLLTDLV